MELLSPMPGTIVDILVNEGDQVAELQEVMVLESMKMENAIPTKTAGTVKQIKVAKGDKVATKQVLMIIE